jgi:hypothetical protein
MIYNLTVIQTKDGKNIPVCATCKEPQQHANGAQNRDQLPYVLSCLKCGGKTLAEWVNVGGERATAFANRPQK